MPEFFDRHRRPPSPPDTEAHARALFEHALALHTDFTQAPAAHKIPRLVEAIQYYQEALRTYTERAFPVHWAATMANLASALSSLKIRITMAIPSSKTRMFLHSHPKIKD